MTKRERVKATLLRQPVDRRPVAFGRHAPDLDHDPRRLADAMLAFHVPDARLHAVARALATTG